LIDGKKYITNGKPKKKWKKIIERTMEPLLFHSLAPSGAIRH